MEAYPLQWPEGWKRTNKPQLSRFGKGIYHKPSIATGKDKILGEVRRLGGKNVVISTNLKLKLDGIGCNLYAIGSSVEAMRAMERWGCSEMLNRAFTGFKALPQHTTPNVKLWFEVLECGETAARDIVYSCFKTLVKKYHPDKPESDINKFHEVQEAWEKAKKINGWV